MIGLKITLNVWLVAYPSAGKDRSNNDSLSMTIYFSKRGKTIGLKMTL